MAKTEPLMAPKQYSMSPTLASTFDKHRDGMLVKQTMKGCLQSACGCQAQSEYKISGLDWAYLSSPTVLKEGAASLPDELYVLEDSSCCIRYWWRDGRPMTVNISQGAEAGGPLVASFKKDCGMPLYFTAKVPIPTGDEVTWVNCIFPCCCALPSFVGTDAEGNEFSTMQYDCDQNYCVGKFTYSEDGQPVYKLAPDTCCFGCCIWPKFGGKSKFVVPFYFHDPKTGEKIVNRDGTTPQIAKVWAGLKKECCSTADTFSTYFPEGCDARRKAGLVGLTVLLDFTVFERQGQAATEV